MGAGRESGSECEMKYKVGDTVSRIQTTPGYNERRTIKSIEGEYITLDDNTGWILADGSSYAFDTYWEHCEPVEALKLVDTFKMDSTTFNVYEDFTPMVTRQSLIDRVRAISQAHCTTVPSYWIASELLVESKPAVKERVCSVKTCAKVNDFDKPCWNCGSEK
jgi:hypothetical protein